MAVREALLIGNSEFTDDRLFRLSAPENDVIALRNVLEDPAIGGFKTTLLLNAGLNEVNNAIVRFFKNRDRDDFLLVYYTGHGLRNDRGRLYLALPDTQVDAPEAVSIHADFLRQAMDDSYSQRHALILDCCHSGAFMRPGEKKSTVEPTLFESDFETGGHGRFVLAASSANESAFEVDGKSLFTKHLVDGLRSGDAAPDKEQITITDLHTYVTRRVSAEGEPMRPQIWVDGQTEPVVIARNPNPRKPLPPDLVEMLWGADPHKAYFAADRIIKIFEGDDPEQSADAEQALRQRFEKPEDLSYLVAEPILKALAPEPTVPVDPRVAELEQHLALAEEKLAHDRQQSAAKRDQLQAALDAERTAHSEASQTLKATLATHKDLEADWRKDRQTLEKEISQYQEQVATFEDTLESAQDEARSAKAQRDEALAAAASKQHQHEADRKSWATERERLEIALDAAKQDTSRIRDTGSEPSQINKTNRALIASVLVIGCLIGFVSAYLPWEWPLEMLGRVQGTFRDCPDCPTMTVIPGGMFVMGSPDDEGGRYRDEGPQREVTIAPFALAATEVTFDQWDACVDDGGCGGYRPDDESWGRGDRPVINVSWQDAQAYIAWLNGKVAGDPYRLPSEAEWEYAARAGTVTPFAFGETISTDQANYNGTRTYGDGVAGVYREQTVPVTELEAANGWGLRHMHGNVWEWVEDCWHGSYAGAPVDGRAWLAGDDGDCTRRVVRGGSWSYNPQGLRSANRFRFIPDNGISSFGFRPARTLTP